MERAAILLVILMSAALGGCLQLGSGPGDEPARDRMAFGAMSGLSDGPGQRSLAAPPAWAAGEWWTYRLETPLYNAAVDVTIVVAGATEREYLVAQPVGEEEILPFIMHIPATGRVSRADLSWHAHDAPWKLLDFPLEPGRSWRGFYWGGPAMALEVESVEGDVATIRLTREGGGAKLAYDAEVGNLVAYEETLENGVRSFRLELIEHGFHHAGSVRLAYDQDLQICHGTASVALGIADCALADPGPPVGSFDLPRGYDAASYAIVINPGHVEDEAAPGLYRVTVRNPAGDTHELIVPATGDGGAMSFHRTDEPAGRWEYEALAAGGGIAIVEGIAHRVLAVELPSGCILSEAPPHLGLAACPSGSD